MRGLACLVALVIGGASLPASAATIVQTDDEFILSGFEPFDGSLGTLNSVTLEIQLFRPRTWAMSTPSEEPVSFVVDWSVDGQWVLPGSAATGGVDIFVPLLGSGSTTVLLEYFEDGLAYGFFGVEGSGGATLALDPGAFLGGPIFFNGYDPGYLDPFGTDTTLTASGSPNLIPLPGACLGPWGPYEETEDYCGWTSYKLTYDFTPGTSAVPEPGTWAMLLLGFAGVGIALRRSRRRTVATA